MRKYYREISAACLSAGLYLAATAVFIPAAFAESADPAYNSQTVNSGPDASYQAASYQDASKSYSPSEIVEAGHGFFGKTTQGFAKAVEKSFGIAGAPTGYIVGEEASGAFFGGLRYGEGYLHMKNGTRKKVYWQGPSFGFDIGGNASRTMVLIYHMKDPDQLYNRYTGIEGSAYLIGGVGVNFQRSTELLLAPIRTGLGARLGANIGYLHYTRAPTWNPF